MSNVIFLAFFRIGILGYFYSVVASSVFSIFLFIVTTNFVREIQPRMFDSKLLRKMLIYSIPLIPNSLMWWLMNASSRFFIVSNHGIETNGLYAVASRIPAVITLLSSIFIQSWQLSAIEESNSTDREAFYSKVYSYYQMFLFVITSFLLIMIKPLTAFAFATEYYPSWEYTPLLLQSVIFSSLSSYLGANYLVAKETKGVFLTSIIGGGLSLILNIILIPEFGGFGAGFSSLCCFLVMWILRVFDTKKYIQIRYDLKKLAGSLAVISAQTFILFIELRLDIELILSFLMFFILLLLYRKSIIELYHKGINVLRQK